VVPGGDPAQVCPEVEEETSLATGQKPAGTDYVEYYIYTIYIYM
jgi:hypothetical protein